MVDAATFTGQTFNYGQVNTSDPLPKTSPPVPDPTGSGNLNKAGWTPPALGTLDASLRTALGALTPKGDPDSGDRASEVQAEHLQSILSSSISGDTATYLARAMLKFYSEQRHEAVLDRQTLGLEAQSEMMDSAAQLDKEADKMVSAAIVSLVTTCVASAITIGTAGVSAAMKGISIGKEIKALKGEMSAMEDLGEAKGSLASIEELNEIGGVSAERVGLAGAAEKRVVDAEKRVKSFQTQFKQAEGLASRGDAVGQVGHAAGQLISAAGEFTSKLTDAEVKHMEAGAKRMDAMAEGFRTQADAKKAIVEALDEMVHQILSFVRDMADAKADRMRSIVRG